MAKATKKAVKRSKATGGKKASAAKGRSTGKGKNLVVVESPAKARTINRYLGRGYLVRASMGHVRDLPKRQMGVDVEKGFAPTYEPLPGRTKVLTQLRKYAKSATQVFLATDLDREGEAIAWHLAESLGVPRGRIRRVIFNEITSGAIREAFDNPHGIDMNKVYAQQARRILDRLVGYEVSPLLWRKVARGLSAGRVQSVTVRLIVERERGIQEFEPQEYWKIGAVFTPDLDSVGRLTTKWAEFLAQRDEKDNPPTQAQQQEFLAAHNAFKGELVNWRGERFNVDNADAALEVAKALGLDVREVQRTEDPDAKGVAKNRVTVVGKVGTDVPEFTVSGLNRRQRRSNPPAPFTTATLQQTAAAQLRFSASRTMRAAQQLYEGVEIPDEGSVGLITYMRTDGRHLSPQAVQQVRSLIAESFGEKYVPPQPNIFRAGQRAQEAHEAIRPTDPTRSPQYLKGKLTPDQFRLYELIWKRFVACQMPPAIWEITDVDIRAQTAGGEALFKAMGRRLEFDGFLRVAGIPKNGEQILPELQMNQPLGPVDLRTTQHFTQPPPPYTEASLVKALEADGIGRPSTYATIIQTIQDRGYVEQIERAFHPTDLGFVVTDKLVKHFPRIFDVLFTAHMEDELDKIEEAEMDWVRVLEEFYGPFSEHLERAKEQMVHAKAETQPSEYSCDACGKKMVYRFSKNGRYLACTGYPKCKTTHPVDKDGKKVERKEVDVPCPVCGNSMVLRRSRYGPFLGCGKYPECKGTVPCDKEGNPLKTVKPEDIKEMCSECGAAMAVRFKGRRAFLGCSKYPKCKNTASVPEGLRIEPPPKAPPKQAGANCPKCGKPMVIRASRGREFLACSGFPRCRNAMSLDKLDQLKAQQAQSEQTSKK